MSDLKPAELKGKFNGNCNITSCQKPGATWWNKSTRKYYCESCALELNRVNRKDCLRLFGHPDLCEEHHGTET